MYGQFDCVRPDGSKHDAAVIPADGVRRNTIAEVLSICDGLGAVSDKGTPEEAYHVIFETAEEDGKLPDFSKMPDRLCIYQHAALIEELQRRGFQEARTRKPVDPNAEINAHASGSSHSDDI